MRKGTTTTKKREADGRRRQSLRRDSHRWEQISREPHEIEKNSSFLPFIM